MIDPEMVAKDRDAIDLGGHVITLLKASVHTWSSASYTYEVMETEGPFSVFGSNQDASMQSFYRPLAKN